MHVWEQLATDQTDPWQVVPRQLFTPYDCLLISVAFVVLRRVGCLWVIGVIKSLPEVCSDYTGCTDSNRNNNGQPAHQRRHRFLLYSIN